MTCGYLFAYLPSPCDPEVLLRKLTILPYSYRGIQGPRQFQAVISDCTERVLITCWSMQKGDLIRGIEKRRHGRTHLMGELGR